MKDRPKNPFLDDPSRGWVSFDQCTKKDGCTCSDCRSDMKETEVITHAEWGGTMRCFTSDGRSVNVAEELNRLESILVDGVRTGFSDSQGNHLCIGDDVKVSKTLVLPNEDGWGRDIQSNGITQYQTNQYIGKIVYLPNKGGVRIKIDKWDDFDIFYFDNIEKISEVWNGKKMD